MSAVSSSITRPSNAVLKKPLQSYFKKHVAIAIVVSAVAGVAYKLIVSDERKKAYKTFYE